MNAMELPRAAWGTLWLAVGKDRFPVSNPVRGDLTRETRPGAPVVPEDGLFTSGVPAAALERLSTAGAAPAALETDDGRRVLELRVERVDRRYNVVVGRVVFGE